MATRREHGMGSVMRRAQRSENSSPYKRRAPEPKLQSSSSLSSFLSFLSNPFRRKSSASVPSPPPDSEQSEEDTDEEEAPELGVKQRGRMVERENPAAETLSRLGHTLQQTIPKPQIPPSIFPSADDSSASGMKASASTSQIAPIPRPRRSVQPSFATLSRVGGRRPGRPTFPGGIASYGGFGGTAEPSPPPFTPSNPLETSFAANRPPASNSQFSFNAKPSIETHNVHGKTNSELLAEFFAAKGKAPLTPEERKKVARLIAESDAESSQSPDADPYNGVPSFSFLKASFPAPERDSLSPSNSLVGSVSAPSTSGLSFNFGSSSRDLKEPSNPTPAVAPRKRRPINYGGSKRSAAITKAGFTLREHQKLLEKQKARQENVAPDSSVVGDKRGVRETEEDGGGKRRKANDGQASAVEETPKAMNGVGKVLSLSAQPSMPSPLRQMTKLNSPSPPRVVLRAQAPSPSSPLSRPATEESPALAKTPTAAKVKPRTSLVADVMRDMLAEDKAREKKEQAKEKPVDSSVFANPYEDVVHQPIVPKVRKPRRVSARPAAKSSATVAKQEEKPLSLIEKIEKTDVRPNTKKARTSPEPPAPQPPTFTFTAPSPRETKPKARRPPPVVEEPTIAPAESDEIEIIDMDEDPKSKSSNPGRPTISVDVLSKPQQNGNNMLGLPGRQRQSFSLHSPARPSPLREMSVPIEDEEDEIVELVSPDKPFGSTNGFGSSAGFGSTNGFGSTTGFGSTGGFGSTTSGFGTTTNGSSLHSFGFGGSSGTFSAPVPPPAPVLAPAQLPAKKEAPKVEAPLFTPKHEVPEPKFTKPEAPQPEVVAPKPVVPAPAPKPVVAPAPEPVVPAPAPAPAPKIEPVVAPKPQTISPPVAPLSEKELKAAAQNTPISSLPAFSFTAFVPSKPAETPESREAASVPLSKLPVFSFGSASTPAPAPAKTASFDWGAAGMKAPSTGAGAQWTCDTCSLSNPASATDKCTICEAPKPKASAPAVAKTASFDWGAAGMKAPVTGGASQWTCGTCSLSNPASATEKCTICEAPKPGAAAPTPAPAPAPAPVAKTASFDWGAAGMKAPTTAGWTCGTCGLSNPATANKCTICDAAR